MALPDKKYDVAILGWWYGKNYGSILTYYGLNRAIDSLGHSILMVHEPLGYNAYRVEWPDDILSMEFARRIGYEYTEQFDHTELPDMNKVAKTFVVGSDQLWNPRIGRVNDDLFLDFVSPENNRVAYGTSFGNRGTEKFTPDFVLKHGPNLQKFKAISVREGYAIDTARKVFGADASLVVDPVFLLPSDHYRELASKATIAPEGDDYLAVFFLDPTDEKKRVAQSIADKLGYKRIVVIPNPDGGRESVTELFADEARAEVIAEDAPENFLRAYRESGYVVTDSFHGTAFANIFEKPFSSIYNKARGADRFENLLESLGFSDSRRVYETDSPAMINDNENVTATIDFTKAREYIASGREESLKWLANALDPKTTGSAAAYPTQEMTLVRPKFTASSRGWRPTTTPFGTLLRIAADGADLGNHVWTDLPEELIEGSHYRMTIEWIPRTAAPAINIHIRNPETGQFRVIASAEVSDKHYRPRTDTFFFPVRESGYSQIMFGGLHFTGRLAAAFIRRIQIDTIPAGAVPPRTPKSGGGAARGGFEKQSMALAISDHERRMRSYNHARTPDGKSGAEARIIFHAHAIEKGLSRSDFRAGFGKIAVPGLAKELNAWLLAKRDIEDPFLQSSLAVMKSYFQRHDEMDVDVSHFRSLFSPEALELIANCTHEEGGVLAADLEREITAEEGPGAGFIEIMYGRRSVREYTREPVTDEEIARAVQIAMQAPSVCNRQGPRVHQFDDPKVIKAVLDIQGGFAGYQMPPRLLLVTSDLDAFLFAPERNQPYVDGGLFMMSLLLGLTHVGLGSVPLNTAMGTEKENAIREIIDIPDHEVFISFIGVGHYDKKVLVPRSKRTSVNNVLRRHTKG